MNKKSILLLSLLALANVASAQDTDFMRSTGKIYVVVAVIVAMLIGMFIFLIYIDKKLSKLEDQIQRNE